MKPYLRRKKNEAELAIRFQLRGDSDMVTKGQQGRKRKTDEERALDEADRILMQNLKNKFSGITTPIMALLKSQKDNPEEAFARSAFPTRDGRVDYHPNQS